MMNVTCKHCSEDFSNKESLELHKMNECFENEYPDLVNYYYSSNLDQTKKKSSNDFKNEENIPFMCQYCPYSCQLKGQIDLHIKNKHKILLKRSKLNMRLGKRNNENLNPKQKISKSTEAEDLLNNLEIAEDYEPTVKEHKRSYKKRKRKIQDFFHKCVICKDELKSFQDYLDHYQEQHQVPIQEKNQCSSCPQKFQNRSHQLDHVIGKHTNHRPFKCKICKQSSKYRISSSNHKCVPKKTKKDNEISDLPRVKSKECDASRKPFTCVICSVKLYGTDEYLQHYNEIHQVPINGSNNCELCGLLFKRKSKHLNHMIANHSDYKPYQCIKCNRSFGCRSLLEYNVCKDCDKNKQSKPLAKPHRSETKKKNCKICSEEIIDVFEHYKKVHDIPLTKDLKCHYCGLQKPHSTHLLIHLCAIHLNIKLFPCKHNCGEKFYYPHTSKKHKCKGKNTLNDSRTQTGPPISDLNMEIEEEEIGQPVLTENLQSPSYHCSICDLSFDDESDHSMHLRIFHGKKQGCRICNFKSTNSEEFQEHFKEKHPKVSDTSIYSIQLD